MELVLVDRAEPEQGAEPRFGTRVTYMSQLNGNYRCTASETYHITCLRHPLAKPPFLQPHQPLTSYSREEVRARTCLIAYGFQESPLEMEILRGLLGARGIQVVEAGGTLAPGQNAYCAKICSKIITSQFCVVLLNNEESNGVEIPNANVSIEYGLYAWIQ